MVYAAMTVILSFFIFCGKQKKPLKTAAAAFFSGGAALIAAHFIGLEYGVDIAVNLFTAVLSLCGGLPFVALIVLLEIL